MNLPKGLLDNMTGPTPEALDAGKLKSALIFLDKSAEMLEEADFPEMAELVTKVLEAVSKKA